MSGFLNPVSLPQTSAVPPQSYREFRSSGLMKAVFWSITLPILAQYSYRPNPQILHHITSCLYMHRSSKGWQPVAWWDSAHAVWRDVTPSHWQWKGPNQLSCADLQSFWSPQPSPTSSQSLSEASARQLCQEHWGKRGGYCEIAVTGKKPI